MTILYRLNSHFVSYEQLMARENKTGINSSFLFHNSWEIVYYTIHDFSEYLKTGTNPAGINRIPSHAGHIFPWKKSCNRYEMGRQNYK